MTTQQGSFSAIPPRYAVFYFADEDTADLTPVSIIRDIVENGSRVPCRWNEEVNADIICLSDSSAEPINTVNSYEPATSSIRPEKDQIIQKSSKPNPCGSKEEEEKKNDVLVYSLSELENLSIYSSFDDDNFHEELLLPRENPHISGKTSETSKSVCESMCPENLQKCRMHASLDDVQLPLSWKAVAAEFTGTLFLVLFGCGSCIQGWPSDNRIKLTIEDSVHLTHNYSTVDIVQIALAFGLSVATVVWIIGHISGGHVNPAVTCAMLITRRIRLDRAFLFIVAQLLGATAGAGILKGVTPTERQNTLGCTILSPGVDDASGIGVEFCITFILVLTVFAARDNCRKDLGGSFPLAIGLSVTMCHLFAVRFTGSSMNTARSFGPAVVMGHWKDQWVYWVGPIFGGSLAGLTYDNVFTVTASLEKCQALFLPSQEADKKYPATIEEKDDDAKIRKKRSWFLEWKVNRT